MKATLKPMRLLAAGMAILTQIVVHPVHAQDYPTKPIRILTTEAGGQSDVVARLIAQGITGPLGQQILIDNRGVLAAEVAVKSPNDGYTLLLNGPFIWLAPLMRKTTTYEPLRDLSPIMLAVTAANYVVVRNTLPVKNIRELIALAKSEPGKLNYATAASGGSPHLAGELFKIMAGVDITRVPYKGIPQGYNDLLAGRIDVMFPTAGSATPHVKSGKIKALAITSAHPSPLFPGVPTVTETGLPGYESGTMTGVFAPGGTPTAIIRRLNQEMVNVMKQPQVKDKFNASGLEVVANSPEEFTALLKSDMARMGKVIKEAGIESD